MQQTDQFHWISTLDEKRLLSNLGNRHGGIPDNQQQVQNQQGGRRIYTTDGSPFPRENETIDEFGSTIKVPTQQTGGTKTERIDFWETFKEEFRELICGKGKKYRDLRKKLSSHEEKGESANILTIAAALSAKFGVAVEAISSYVFMCLLALVRLGKNAFCRSSIWDMKIEPRK
jgi:hypothetical protein